MTLFDIIHGQSFRLSSHNAILAKTTVCCTEPFLDVCYKESTEGKTFIFGESVASNTLNKTSKYYRCQFVNKAMR